MDPQRRKKMAAAVNQLIIDRTFSVAKKGRDIILVKMIARKPVTILLTDTGEGFWIDPPKHEFSCSYSHFEFAEREQRCTRRKTTLMQLVMHLQKTKVWDFVLNKTFFIPNPDNSKMNKKVIADQYNFIMGSVQKS